MTKAMTRLPKTRSENIVVQPMGDELLIYDLGSNKAYCLNKTSMTLYNACGAGMDLTDLKLKQGFTDSMISFGLDELLRADLIEDRGEDFLAPFAGMSRRQMVKHAGLASAIALPVIASLVAPTAIHAQSCVGPGSQKQIDGAPCNGQGSCQNCACAVAACKLVCCTGCCTGNQTALYNSANILCVC